MANKLTNPGRTLSMQILNDTNGDYVLLPNGKKWYMLTTANTTTTSAAAGSYGCTTHATGLASIFRSDGSKWQYLTNA